MTKSMKFWLSGWRIEVLNIISLINVGESNVLQIAKLFWATRLTASSRQPCKLQVIFPAFAKVRAEVLRGQVTHSVSLRFKGLQTEASVSDSMFHVFPY